MKTRERERWQNAILDRVAAHQPVFVVYPRMVNSKLDVGGRKKNNNKKYVRAIRTVW